MESIGTISMSVSNTINPNSTIMKKIVNWFLMILMLPLINIGCNKIDDKLQVTEEIQKIETA